MHLKDVRDEVVAEVKANDLSFLEGVRKGTFTVPGDGVIDFRPIFDILENTIIKAGWWLRRSKTQPSLTHLNMPSKAVNTLKKQRGSNYD